MAPPKFQPPIRKSNGSGSDSSYSFSSFCQDVDGGRSKATSKPVSEPVKSLPTSQSSEGSQMKMDSSSSSSSTLKRKAECNSDSAKEKDNISSNVTEKSVKETQVPAKKKLKEESASTSKSKVKAFEDSDSNKENFRPVNANKLPKKAEGSLKKQHPEGCGASSSIPKKQGAESHSCDGNKQNIPNGNNEKQTSSTNKKRPKDAARPAVSLSDSEYERLFKAVLSRTDSENRPNALDASRDLFDISNSDLDFEEEETKAHTVKTANDDPNAEASLLSKRSDLHDPCGSASEPTADEECKPSVVIPNEHQSTSEGVHIDKITSTPRKQNDLSQNVHTKSPTIVYLCNASQPTITNNSIHNESNFEGDSLSQQSDGAGLTVSSVSCLNSLLKSDKNALLTSTPIPAKRPGQSTTPSSLVTPQKITSQCRTPTLSQGLTASPIANSSQSSRTPAETPIKASSPAIQISQASQGSKTTTSTLKRLPSTAATSQSPAPSTPRINQQLSQDILCTPRVNQPPSQDVLVTPRVNQPSSQDVLRTPLGCHQLSQDVPRTPLGSQQLSQDVPRTPLGSQQLTQEVQHTPPPVGLTAKDRLLWLQQKRLAGLWVQCENEECEKWRYLPDSHDPTTLPAKWYCSMHPDAEQNNCEAPNKRLSLQEEEDMIFNKYSPGSLVWARLPGFPWWPAMVDDDPDLEQFYWLDLFCDIPTWYHVVFFDDKEPVTRAWIQVERLQSFKDRKEDDSNEEVTGYKKRVSAAYKKARKAMSLGLAERLSQHGFATSYKGAIGGGPRASKRKYQGPLGHREPLPSKQ